MSSEMMDSELLLGHSLGRGGNASLPEMLEKLLPIIDPNGTIWNALTPEEQIRFLQSLDEHMEINTRAPEIDFIELRVHRALGLYLPPIFLILGTFGNIFAFLILRNKTMTRQSTNLFLAALAIADSTVLLVGLLRRWVSDISGIDVQSETNWLCKTVSVLGYSSSQFSVWLIIAVTIERYIAVSNPLHASRYCNLTRAKRIIGLLAFIFIGINSHLFLTVTLKQKKNGDITQSHCEAADRFEILVSKVWPWIDAALYALVPFFLIVIFNSLIIRQTVRATTWRGEAQKGPLINLEKRKVSTDNNVKLTIMLLTVSFTFLFTTFPMTIMMVLHDKWEEDLHDASNTIHILAQRRLVRTIAEMLMYLNHSINFYLYCALGQKFRNQVIKTLCGRTISNNSNASDHSQHLYCSRINGYHIHKSTDETTI